MKSFGRTPEQCSCIPKFISQLANKCEQLGIFLNKNMIVNPFFEQIQVMNNVSSLECKLRKLRETALSSLQLLVQI